MKRLAFQISLLVGIVIAASAPFPLVAARDTTAEKVAVEQALHAFFDAVKVKNWLSIDTLLASDFQFYSDSALVLDKAGFIAAMKDDDMDVEQLTLEDVRVMLSNQGDVAWIKYRANLESKIRGKPYNMMSVETVVFHKEHDVWKMVHNHASVKRL